LKKPQGEILDGNIKIGDGWASDTGIYEVCHCISFFVHKICTEFYTHKIFYELQLLI